MRDATFQLFYKGTISLPIAKRNMKFFNGRIGQSNGEDEFDGVLEFISIVLFYDISFHIPFFIRRFINRRK